MTTQREMKAPENPLRVFAASPADFFTDGMREIERTRMAGLPVLNPRLAVRAVEFRRWGNDWLGVLVTPWSIVALYACGSREGWVDVPPGRERLIELPAGDFPFVSMDDPVLGRFLLLSLKSPVLDVGDQETADAIARISLETMLKVTEFPADDEDAAVWTPPRAKGELRRVIPIKVAPLKNYAETPSLTPKAPEPEEKRGKLLEKKVSRREFFGRGRRYVEKAAEAPKVHALEAAAPGEEPAVITAANPTPQAPSPVSPAAPAQTKLEDAR